MNKQKSDESAFGVAAGSASELLKQWNCAIKDPTETLRVQQGDMSLIVWFLDKAIKQLAAIESNQPNTKMRDA